MVMFWFRRGQFCAVGEEPSEIRARDVKDVGTFVKG